MILDEPELEGWELVSVVPVVDNQPRELVDRQAALAALQGNETEEVVALEAFRCIFKRPLE